ncbi:hypothetical protein BTW10_13075 [Chromohalobacter japonicus]|uniref:Uncharacterized protein n=1 Tax=Chromohalobacter japonicus TaxID=223900 RepID=A0A1Q8TAC5_9GAMM|nr:hypothetical protein [Chromohalobacter japonicus]OLO10633.1 hypothetical protein BTW10_13075 [Chromohalobacter japonicus]
MAKLKDIPEKFAPGYMGDLDGRTGIAQMMRERYASMTSDLGGPENLSYAQRSLVERALWLEFWLQRQEVELAKGESFDVGKWVQAANGLQGILTKLGLERKAKDVPNLSDYLAQRGGKQ